MTLHELGVSIYDKKFEKLPQRNVSLLAYLASYKYFMHVEDQLRLDLTFKSNILNTAQAWLEKHVPRKWKGHIFTRVVMHVRRTDFTQAKQVGDGWHQPTSEYFQRSMAFFTDCLERVQFVVLSDDPPWCQKHVNGSDVIYSSGNTPIIDMAIASLCDHAIITVGSYGWWAAWFANGITITQKDIPRTGTKLSQRMHREDYYKTDYVGL